MQRRAAEEMPRNHRARLQLGDALQGGQPVFMRLRALSIGHPQVDVVGDDHTADDGLDRRNPHKAAIRLRAVQADHFQVLPFKRQAVAGEHLRHDGFAWFVGAHFRAPERQFAGDGSVDVVDHRLRGQHLGIGECGGEGVEAEVIVWVAVADVDGGQVFAAGADLLHQLFGLAFAELRVDQDRVFRAADQHRTDRKDRGLAGVIYVEGQLGGGGLGGEGQGGGRQGQALEGGKHRAAPAIGKGRTELSCNKYNKKCDAGT